MYFAIKKMLLGKEIIVPGFIMRTAIFFRRILPEKMLAKVQKEKLWVNPDCGLKTRGEEETVASLKNLVTAARLLREKAGA